MITINVKTSSDEQKAELIDAAAAGFAVKADGDRAVVTGPDGLHGSFSATDLTHIDVSIGDQKVVVAHYSGAAKEMYCCVTCSGYTFCGDSACCQLSNGSWLCC